MIYFFSGRMTDQIRDIYMKFPNFEPINALITQFDRKQINYMIDYQKSGFISKLFIDSGAYSIHSKKVSKANQKYANVDSYIEFVNSIDDHLHIIAQLDTIPGTHCLPKLAEDYVISAEKSWDNFLYMYERLKSPEKLIPVFHYGESFQNLDKMLNWRDKNGKLLSYIGIAAAKDTHRSVIEQYLKVAHKAIAQSNNPNIKSHLFGMTGLNILPKIPAYSADSVTHWIESGCNRVIVPELGRIALSKHPRRAGYKADFNFLKTADEKSIKKLQDYIDYLGCTIEDLEDSFATRCAVSMYTILQEIKQNPYKRENVLQANPLFKL